MATPCGSMARASARNRFMVSQPGASGVTSRIGRAMPRPLTPEDAMRGFLSGDDPNLARMRRVMRHLPHGPHCKLCAAPFEGPAGAVLRHVGFARFSGNPAICAACIKSLNKLGVYGAEIRVSLVFADIRGSTGIGERSSPTEFRSFLDHFYRLSSTAILDNDGMVDKFVGDEVIGLFFAGISGPHHTGAAIRAARVLLDASGRADASHRGPIPVGAAVHTGDAFVGSTGAGGAVSDFTALGDIVNTTARLAAEAAAGELLVSIQAAQAGELDSASGEQRTLRIRGRSDAVEVVALSSSTRL
jgi:adenylate cyclase